MNQKFPPHGHGHWPTGPAGTSAAGRRLLSCAVLCLATLCARTPGATSGPERTNSCVTSDCHSDDRDQKHVHGPVAMGVCKFCHKPARGEEHEFRLAREGGDLCSFCHWEIEPDRNIHSGLGSGECISCHNPHGTDYRFLLSAERIEDACEDCHADLLGDKRVLHTPVATGPCTVCHDPHNSDLGRAAAADVCFRCHEATREELETLDHVHEPVKSGNCDECHDPHGSDSPMNLREAVPALCYRCHEEIRKTVETAIHGHSVAREPGGCLKCHTPHASSVAFGLRSDPFTLCLGCHEDDVVTEAGETIPGIASQIEGRKYLHGPVRQRDCGACHNSHGGEHFRLLIEAYPAEFYTRFDIADYRLCFTCHPQRGVLTERTTELTDFRNGSLNLHYLHVNRPDKSRTCRACHATHGSDQPKHISDRVWFGQWQMPFKFVKTATGASCQAGCHSARAYDREAPIDYGEMKAPAGATEASLPGEETE